VLEILGEKNQHQYCRP